MLGKNLLWVAKQHGHSVEVMLRMYAAWLGGATESDIRAIKQAMEKSQATRTAIPDARAAISAAIVCSKKSREADRDPSPESRGFGSSLAVRNRPGDSSLRKNSQIKWRWGQSRANPSLPEILNNSEKTRKYQSFGILCAPPAASGRDLQHFRAFMPCRARHGTGNYQGIGLPGARPIRDFTSEICPVLN
jgi:hypothetical protein